MLQESLPLKERLFEDAAEVMVSGGRSKDLRKWRSAWSNASLGLEIAGCVVVGLLAGRWADGRWGTEPWLMLLGMAAGITAAGRAIWRVVKTETREQKIEGRQGDDELE